MKKAPSLTASAERKITRKSAPPAPSKPIVRAQESKKVATPPPKSTPEPPQPIKTKKNSPRSSVEKENKKPVKIDKKPTSDTNKKNEQKIKDEKPVSPTVPEVKPKDESKLIDLENEVEKPVESEPTVKRESRSQRSSISDSVETGLNSSIDFNTLNLKKVMFNKLTFW